MAVPVRQNGTTLTGAPGTSAVVTLPASIAAGDVVVVYLYKENTNAVTPPAGFTEKTGTGVPATTTAPQGHYVFWKRMSGGESGTVTFSWTGSVFCAAAAERYSGCVAAGDPIELIAGSASNASVATLNVALTGTSADTLLVWSGTNFTGGNAWTPPTGYTERADIDVISDADKDNAAGGNTGNVTGTSIVSGPMTAILLSLASGGATASAPPVQPARPGRTWERRFKHRQTLFAPPPAATAGPVAVNPALETDTAQPLGRQKVKALGTAVETDTAQTLGERKTRTLGIAPETDASVGIARSKARTASPAAETDAVQQLGRRKIRALGIATELDEAVSTPRLVPALGIALETDTAQAFGRRKVKALGIAVETDTAVTIVRQHKRLTGIAVETDTAVHLVRAMGRTVNPAVETDAARPLGRRKSRAIGIAAESDSAVLILAPVKAGTAHAATSLVPAAFAAAGSAAAASSSASSAAAAGAASMTVPTAKGA